MIAGPEHPHNFAWGNDDGKTLYLCAKTGLYRIRMNVPGFDLDQIKDRIKASPSREFLGQCFAQRPRLRPAQP
jgi:hypothetical protein